MQNLLPVFTFIRQNLQLQKQVMLLYVLQSKGSSPGREGFCMAVNTENKMVGSIGGGIMEHKFIELAKAELKDSPQTILVKRQVHDKAVAKDQSGMICSGEQTNLLYQPGRQDLDAINELISRLQSNKQLFLNLSKAGIKVTETLDEDLQEGYHEHELNWAYIKQVGTKPTLFIIGAGHCSLQLSRVMSFLGFTINLFDERKELNTFEANTFATSKTIINSYSQLQELILNPGSYVVIMTMGYKTDALAIRSLINKDLSYLGVLGSKKKIEKLFADFRNEGMNEDLINKIHAPIGVAINSKTPEEIAISIAAEIISVKNKG